MKGRVFIAGGLPGKWCLSIAVDQSSEIFNRLWSHVTKEAKDDSLSCTVVTNFDIKIDTMRYFR